MTTTTYPSATVPAGEIDRGAVILVGGEPATVCRVEPVISIGRAGRTPAVRVTYRLHRRARRRVNTAAYPLHNLVPIVA